MAGLSPWEKLFVALRATRDTELRESFPVHVVEAWLGHEDRVAKRNYTQITDEHFRLAANSSPRPRKKVAQKAAQQLHESGTHDDATGNGTFQKTRQIAGSNTTLQLVAKVKGGGDRNRTCTSLDTRS